MAPHERVLIVDAANVVGSRPDGWWRDRAGAARRLCSQVGEALRDGQLEPPVVVVLEGAARPGVPEGDGDGMTVVHAPGSGDDAIVAAAAPGSVVVTADRELQERVRRAGAEVIGVRWLLDRMTPE